MVLRQHALDDLGLASGVALTYQETQSQALSLAKAHTLLPFPPLSSPSPSHQCVVWCLLLPLPHSEPPRSYQLLSLLHEASR